MSDCKCKGNTKKAVSWVSYGRPVTTCMKCGQKVRKTEKPKKK